MTPEKNIPILSMISLNQMVKYWSPAMVRKGLTYFRQGRVTHLDVRDKEALAFVHGTTAQRYECFVESWDGGILGNCTCPYWVKHTFCKHLAAVGFALLDLKPKGDGVTPGPLADAPVSPPKVMAYLESLPPAKLKDLLVEEALENPILMARLNHEGARFSLRKAGYPLKRPRSVKRRE